MISSATKTELEILDIRHFSGRQLRPLLEHEARMWQQRLRWDYASATELLLQYLDSRVLPGFAALDRGRICGFAFCVYEGSKAVIGDAFATDNSVLPSLATTHALIQQLLQLLAHSPEIDRIESQLLLYDTRTLAQPFEAARFTTHRRLFMEADLTDIRAQLPHHAPPPLAAGDLVLERWLPEDYEPAAELIRRAYIGHIDAQINDQYRTLQGCLRFLHNIIRFPGCGTFDPRSSWVLREPANLGPYPSLVALALCSRVRNDTAHLTQLCVGGTHRGRRLGAGLLTHTLVDLARIGFKAVSLTVTEANRPAVDLYLAMGFTIRHTFDAFVRDAGPGRL